MPTASNHNENPLLKYSKLLNARTEHLSYEVLSIFTNLPEDLSEKEALFIENHLRQCNECTQKFNEVFDDEFDFDNERFSISVRTKLESGRGKRKVLAGRNFEIELQKGEGEELLLSFRKIPPECIGRKMRMTLIASGVRLRLRHIERNRPFAVAATENVQFSAINEIEIEVLAKTLLAEESRSLPKSKPTFYFRYAAAAAIVLTLASALLLMRNRTDVDPPGATQAGQAYAENPVLENFIDRSTRAQGEFAILAPAIGDTVVIPFALKWQSPEAAQVQVIVVNNQNQEVWQKRTQSSEVEMVERLPEGLYYWKILAESSLVGVGKFVVPE